VSRLEGPLNDGGNSDCPSSFKEMLMITASVGQGGANRPHEVRAVQLLLNDWREQNRLPPIRVDGLVGPETIRAILAFQTSNALPQDGRIDPEGPTLRKAEGFSIALHVSALSADLTALLNSLYMRLGTTPLPLPLGQRLLATRRMVQDLYQVQAAAAAAAGSAIPFRGNRLGFANLPTPLFGFVQAVPIIFVVFFFLVLMLLVLSTNPVWQRNAREMMKGLIERLNNMMKKLSEEIEEALENVERAIQRKENSRCAMLCSEQLILFRQLSAEAIRELTEPPPADPTEKEKRIFRINNLIKRWQQALEDLLNCFAANGCTF
jgi:hypothetical protein